MNINIKVIKPFLPLFKGELKKYREIIYFSGRGLGKTKSIIYYLFLQALQEKKTILCLRKYEQSQKYSMIKDFTEIIHNFNVNINKQNFRYPYKDLSDVLKIENKRILFHNGSSIYFTGISDYTVNSLKSFSNIDIVFYDECNSMSKYAYDILMPTVRNENSQLIFSFNPQNNEDFIYQRAINALETPNDYTYVYYGTWRDNPLFPNVMHRDRLQSLKNDSKEIYEWIWEGKPLANSARIIDTNKIGFFDDKQHTQYSKIFITMDTAFTKNTNSDYSVILLCGVHYEELHILRILRGQWEFSELSTNLIYMYNFAMERYKKTINPIIIEEKGSGISLIQELKRQTNLLNIRPNRPSTDKRSIQSIHLHKIETLRLPIDKDNILNSWVDVFLKELNDFRKDMKHEHDDIVDCVVYALQYIESAKKQPNYTNIIKNLNI